MKIYALPLPNKRLFFHCLPTLQMNQTVTLHDKIVNRVAKTWNNWKMSNSTIKKKVVEFGNYAVNMSGHEELALREIAAAGKVSNKQLHDSTVVYHAPNISSSFVYEQLGKLAMQRQLHSKYLLGNILGLPLTIPVILIPLIPNLPGFYLCYRAYCNWRAMQGAAQLDRLFDTGAIKLRVLPMLMEACEAFQKGNPASLKKLVEGETLEDRYRRAINHEST
ncbi:hypothetical protein SJAG_02445 [Schizosaccharomyces japonicus yFS275]|uniref:Uncharacterized protein n=1 Tax=Schizosaccharomyces japonicus (strain yFS275 / FY16936) TaxID=402676 RepID=B6K2H7_SCHJY|nr:hypothetical protein SJAG_02445 [Schizosaccharomyces japonicus yFS275]EEB07358.1 hypothetical protein SJAG_02445 [Schizosaccharomyces japonicus yFS275]